MHQAKIRYCRHLIEIVFDAVQHGDAFQLSKFGDEQCMIHNSVTKSELETSPRFLPALKAVLLAQSHPLIRTEAQSYAPNGIGNKYMSP